MTTSKFQNIQANGINLEHVKPIKTNGATCDTYRVRIYGKLHFLKRLKPELAFDPRYAEAFKKEFLTGYNLNHPNLVGYVLHGNDAQGPFMLLDYVEGETLSEKINNSPSYFESKENLNKILRQLLSCLSYLHSNQVVHLDLKPDNIMLTKVGNDVKVLDLGFCYTDGYNTTMGKSDNFAAPEQKDGSGDVDARTDIYAVGKILQLISPKSPYIYRCINPDKSKRFQSADEMFIAINNKAKKRSFVLVALTIVSILITFIFSKTLNTKTEITSVVNHVPTTTKSTHDTIIITQRPTAVTIKPTTSALTELATVKQEAQQSNKSKVVAVDTAKIIEEFKRKVEYIFRSHYECYKDSSYERYKATFNFSMLEASHQAYEEALVLCKRYPGINSKKPFDIECAIGSKILGETQKELSAMYRK